MNVNIILRILMKNASMILRILTGSLEDRIANYIESVAIKGV